LYALGVPEKSNPTDTTPREREHNQHVLFKTVPTQVIDAMEKLQQALPNSLSGNELATGTWNVAASPDVN
jgi:hypothetical protein